MRSRLYFLLLVGIFMVIPVVVWATEVSVVEISDKDTKVSYNGNLSISDSTYPVLPADGPAGWNSDPGFNVGNWSDPIPFKDNAWLDPKSAAPFQDTSAEWISISKDGKGDDADLSDGSRGVYLYRKTFKVPASAYNITGEVGIAADNYGWLYLNGDEVLSPRQPEVEDSNYQAPPNEGTIPIDTLDKLACDNVLAAEVQNGCGNCGLGGSNVKNGVTGVVFSMKLDYELPDVIWRPPVSNSNFLMKNGSTLPLKFRLFTQEGSLVKRPLEIYLAVHEGGFNSLGNIVGQWALGRSVKSLRFAKGAGQYVANFQTNKKNLQNGSYTAVVHDMCTDEVLGYIEFQMNSPKKQK